MASPADRNPKSRTGDEHSVDIPDESEGIQHSQGVCVCKVPNSLKAAKPEAFIPQFVGLGPYHHYRPELIMTDQLKLAAVKRALKQDFHLDSTEETLRQRLSDSDIQAFYHIDVSSKYNYHTLLHVLTVDGLFLLGLLHRAAAKAKPAGEDSDSYFLSGKHGMPLLNYADVELTTDAIIRDVFMLENQIPTHFLKQIKEAVSNKKEIQPHGEVYKDLNETMQNFCQSLCPFVLSKEPSKKPKAHHHLLDLMYQLTVPESDPEPPCHAQKDHRSRDKRRSVAVCCGIPVVILVTVCFVLGLIVKLIMKQISRMVGQIVNLLLLIGFMVVASCNCEIPRSIQLKSVPDQIKKRLTIITTHAWDYLPKRDDKDAPRIVTIQSVTELHSAGIKFLPTQGGISTIHFDAIKCQFHLPTIKVDVNSEVIFRNLVAYETLTKSECLIFTRYIELMRAIIDTPDDVKLLVQEGIIDTELTYEVVEQLFNGMSKSIRPTKTPVLDGVIHNVKAKFESTQGLKRVVNYMYSSWKIITAIAALIFLLLQAVQAYCSIFSCSRNRA